MDGKKMTSGYVIKKVIAGDTIDVYKYWAARKPGLHLPRSGNVQITSAEQELINRKNSRMKLEYLILSNFRRNDIRLDLTYAGLEPTAETAKKELDKFLRKLRNKYHQSGNELKWVATTEHRGHRIHHHLLLNGIGWNRAEYEKLWTWAKINHRSYQNYDGGEDDAHNVAGYFVKETSQTFRKPGEIQKRRWRSSRNLVKPKIIKKSTHSKSWRDNPKPKKGYYIARVNNKPDNYGNPRQYYRMIRDEENESIKEVGERNVHNTSCPAEISRYRKGQGKHPKGP